MNANTRVTTDQDRAAFEDAMSVLQLSDKDVFGAKMVALDIVTTYLKAHRDRMVKADAATGPQSQTAAV